MKKVVCNSILSPYCSTIKSGVKKSNPNNEDELPEAAAKITSVDSMDDEGVCKRFEMIKGTVRMMCVVGEVN